MTYVKQIHQIWQNLGHGSEVPEKYKPYQESWKRYNPSWQYILWNEKMGDKLIKTYYPQYYKLYKNVAYPIMKIDILRYCILEQYGGLYADIDYKCLHNFDDYLLKNNKYLIHINETPNEISNLLYGKTVSNSLLISTKPYNKFWKMVINECFHRIKTYSLSYHVYYVIKTTGPGLLNDILNKIKTTNNKQYEKINLLPVNQFNYCNDCHQCYPSKTKTLYAVHDYASYWNSNSWLQIRKLYSCWTPKDILFIICIIIMLCFVWRKFRS